MDEGERSNLCTGIFHKESAVCTLNCLLNFLSVFDGATVFIQRHDWNWSIKQCETMFANPTKLDRLACPALMRSTLHIEGGGGYLFEKLLNCRNSRSNPSLPPGHVLASLSVADKYTLYLSSQVTIPMDKLVEIPSLRGNPITKQVWNSKDKYIPNGSQRQVSKRTPEQPCT